MDSTYNSIQIIRRNLRKSNFVLVSLLSILLLLVSGGCKGISDDGGNGNGNPPPTDARDQIMVADLTGNSNIPKLHYDYFLPIGTTETAESFSGRLAFAETRMQTTQPSSNWEGGDLTLFPAFSIEFVSHESALIPLTRGLILSGEVGLSFWNIMVGPGRIWKETADEGYSRASFPFTLTTNGVGQARNGVATFVYRGLEVSNVFIQIAQETSPIEDYTHDDFVALVPVSYGAVSPLSTARSQEVIADYEAEVAARYPVEDWSRLTNAGPLRTQFNTGLSGTDISMAALLVDGTLYRQTPMTRMGPYPYPDVMRHGVFSVTKTLCGALSMFYLARKYGHEEVFDAKVTDYVPILADHPGWEGVTFEHCLNMVTGTDGDDDGPYILDFIRSRSTQQRLNMVRSIPDAAPLPGETFKYVSTNTFILSYAMNQYVKAKEGPAADYWDMLTEEVLEPMGVQRIPLLRSSEPDGTQGTPVLGWGSYPTADEAAKVARLMLDDGVYQGQQLIDLTSVRQGVRSDHWPGYVDYYKHSVWRDTVSAGGCLVDIPMMVGRGGNYVFMMHSGIVGIRFSDAAFYQYNDHALAMEAVRSSCN